MLRGTRFLAALAAAVVVAVTLGGADARSDRSAATPGTPLLGVNLIQYRLIPPYCWGNPILLDYHNGFARGEVVQALHAMRAAGVETLRLQLVHMHATDHWIPSDGPRAFRGKCSLTPGRQANRLPGCRADFQFAPLGFRQNHLQPIHLPPLWRRTPLP